MDTENLFIKRVLKEGDLKRSDSNKVFGWTGVFAQSIKAGKHIDMYIYPEECQFVGTIRITFAGINHVHFHTTKSWLQTLSNEEMAGFMALRLNEELKMEYSNEARNSRL